MEQKPYKSKMDDLQAKIRKSKMEHRELEHEFKQMMKERNECERPTIRTRHKRLGDDDRRRTERNERLLQKLDRVDYQAAALAAKSERLKLLKTHYELYLMHYANPLPQQQIQMQQIRSSPDTTILGQYQYPLNQYQLPKPNLAKFLAQKNQLPFNDADEIRSINGNFVVQQQASPLSTSYSLDPRTKIDNKNFETSFYPKSVIPSENNNPDMTYKETDEFYRSLNAYDRKGKEDNVIYDNRKSPNIIISTSSTSDDNDKTRITNYTNQDRITTHPHSIATQRLIDYNCQNNRQMKFEDDMKKMYPTTPTYQNITPTTIQSSEEASPVLNNSACIPATINNSSVPFTKSVSETRKTNRDGVIENIHQIWEKVIDEDKTRFNNQQQQQQPYQQQQQPYQQQQQPYQQQQYQQKFSPSSPEQTIAINEIKTINNDNIINNDKMHVKFHDTNNKNIGDGELSSSYHQPFKNYDSPERHIINNKNNNKISLDVTSLNLYQKNQIVKELQPNNYNDNNNLRMDNSIIEPIIKNNIEKIEDTYYGEKIKHPSVYTEIRADKQNIVNSRKTDADIDDDDDDDDILYDNKNGTVHQQNMNKNIIDTKNISPHKNSLITNVNNENMQYNENGRVENESDKNNDDTRKTIDDVQQYENKIETNFGKDKILADDHHRQYLQTDKLENDVIPDKIQSMKNVDNNNIVNPENVADYYDTNSIKTTEEEIKKEITNNENKINEKELFSGNEIVDLENKTNDVEPNLIKVDQQEFSYQEPDPNIYAQIEGDDGTTIAGSGSTYPNNYPEYQEYPNTEGYQNPEEYQNPVEYQNLEEYQNPEAYQNPEEYQNPEAYAAYQNPVDGTQGYENPGEGYESQQQYVEGYEAAPLEYENPQEYGNIQDYNNTQVYTEGDQQYQNPEEYGNDGYQQQPENLEGTQNYDPNYDQYAYENQGDSQLSEGQENHPVEIPTTIAEPAETYYADEPGQNYYEGEQTGNEAYYPEGDVSQVQEELQSQDTEQLNVKDLNDVKDLTDDNSTTYSEELGNIPQPLVSSIEPEVPIVPAQKEKKRVNFADSESEQSSEPQIKQEAPDDSDFDFSAS